MDFQEFKSKSPNLKKIKLPGEEAHYKLAPLLRLKELEQKEIEIRDANKAGVLAVFYPDKSEKTHFVLILRKTYRGVHSNQVGFPGGRMEEGDKDLEQTALRETEEEVGIPQKEIKVLKQMTKIYIPPSNFWVQPFMGLMEKTPVLIPQESEVESVLEIALEDFMNDSALTRQKLSTSYAKNIEVPAFMLSGHIVWGATAMMLSEMKEVLRQVL
ncbi:NUDIX hydrolase [Salinimicrobium sp. GXAS 041]|uniref:NUDIX hydrolase n=1 Tax=Salinimicrobium sp. GXAS 041 TaxID=3400806 RepID=UPI003C727230